MGTSKNSEFAQLLRCGKNFLLTYQSYAALRNFFRNAAVGMKSGFLEVPLWVNLNDHHVRVLHRFQFARGRWRAAYVVAVARRAVRHDALPSTSFTCPGSNGSIMPCCSAILRIHLSALMLIKSVARGKLQGTRNGEPFFSCILHLASCLSFLMYSEPQSWETPRYGLAPFPLS